MKILNFDEYIKGFDEYIEEIKKETEEESTQKLISMGILQKNGKL